MDKNMVNNTLDRLISMAIYALFIVPFLIPYSYFPVSKFYSEILTLIIAMAIMVLAVFRVERINIASVGIASFLFMCLLLLQIILLNIRIPGINIAIAIEFMVALLLSVAITSLVNGNEDAQQKLVINLAWALLISVTIQALYGFLQYTGQANEYKSFILTGGSPGSNVFGNIGQKNDYADFISMGIFALAYLFFIRKINLVVFIIYALFFGFIITINSSRTSFTYFIFAILASLIWIWINRKSSEKTVMSKQILIILGGMFIGLLVLEALIPKLITMFASSGIDSQAVENTTSGLYRFSENAIGQSTYRRFYEWYKDIIMFIQHPLFGVGWYQYPREAIYLMNTERFMYIPANSALYTHSHNSPLNILAETGIIGFGITMVYGFFYSLYRIFKDFNNHTSLFLSFIILTIFAQSCFQYPLWYAYFLIYFVLLLSVSKPIFSVKNNKIFKLVATLIFLSFVGFCGINARMYEQMLYYTAVPQDLDDYAYNVQ
ncbi:MAG: O-antigen ligase family protein [Burkholderiales bacterium]|nr:O-antigen ligase family protein [Burkholderiales bacterium]